MTFTPSFGRPFSPSFKPNSLSGGGYKIWYTLDGLISAANCKAAYQPKGAADYATSKVNLANPGTYNATDVSAPAWDATDGWKFNGTTNALEIAITNMSAYGQNNSYAIRIKAPTKDGAVFGYSQVGQHRFGINFWAGVLEAQNDGIASPTQAYADGVYIVAGNKVYKNGVDYGSTINTIGGSASLGIKVGCRNFNGTNVNFPSDAKVLALSLYQNLVLTPTQVGLLTTAMNAL